MHVLRPLFPAATVDDETIVDALDATGGDVDAASVLLKEILREEREEEERAAVNVPTTLTALMSTVTELAGQPREQQPVELHERLMRLCTHLDGQGIHLLRPVQSLLDGERDEAALITGLDEADEVVVRQLLMLTLTRGTVEDELDAPMPWEGAYSGRVADEEQRLLEEQLLGEFDESLQLIARLHHSPQHRDAFVDAFLRPLETETGVGLLRVAQQLWNGGHGESGAGGLEVALAGRLRQLASEPDSHVAVSPSAEAASLEALLASKAAEAEAQKDAVQRLKAALVKQRMRAERARENAQKENPRPKFS
jgi:hypothetical protein